MKRCLPLGCLAILLQVSAAFAQPLGDHHQHLLSATVAALMSSSSPSPVAPTDASDLIRALDEAGMRRAAVLSMAYIFSQPSRKIENDYEKVRTENDWTAAQVARFPERLIGFCALNPIRDYALAELERCATIPQLRSGLKLHFGNSVVDYHNPEHLEKVRRVFRAANEHRMAIVVHMRASVTQQLPYGREEALIFLNEILPAAPDVMVQIAHLSGAGGYEPVADQALRAFIDAIQNGDPRTKQLWFDVSGGLVPANAPDQLLTILAMRIRSLGVGRVLYGTDALSPTNLPRDGWSMFRKLPLTDAEFATIAGNVPPYMRLLEKREARQRPPAPSPQALVNDVRTLTLAQDNDQRFEVITRLLRERNVPFVVEPFTIERPIGREPRTHGRNIVVSLGEGRDAVVVGAHYDAVRLPNGSLSRGAVDNGASSIILVHLAEALRAEPMPVRIVWFDMEETGHFGSLNYVEAHARDRIRAMLNFDINAYGDTVLFAAPPGADDARLRATIVQTCADETVDCIRSPRFPDSDDRSFGSAGIPTLSIAMLPAAEAHQFWLYENGGAASGLARGSVPSAWRMIHTVNDVLENVDGSSMARMRQFAWALVRRVNALQ